MYSKKSILQMLGPMPGVAVPGKKWVSASSCWQLQDEKLPNSKSFKELPLDKIKGPQEKKKSTRKCLT